MKMKYDNNSISISIGLSGWKSVWLKVFNATFTNISAISWRSVFVWWRKPEYHEETTNLSQVTDKLYHI